MLRLRAMSRRPVMVATASGSRRVLTIGHSGISGSPSKYIWVINRVEIEGPITETWICAGRQLLTSLGQG